MQSDRNKYIIMVSVIIAISFVMIYLTINYIFPLIGKSSMQSHSNGKFNPFGLLDDIISAIVLLEIVIVSIGLAVGLPGIIIKYLNNTNHYKSILLGLSTGSLMLLPFLFQEILDYSDILKLIFFSVPGAYLVFASL